VTKKIFNSTMIVACVVLLLSLVIIIGCLYEYFEVVELDQLEDELDLAAVGVERVGVDYLKEIHSDTCRFTWIDGEGKVIYDTDADESIMENHAQREEIIEALEDGKGQSIRYSDTILEKTIY